MIRGLPMPVRGATAWRTCRRCGERMRIECFAKSATASGYGPLCRPCYREKLRKEAKLAREWARRDKEAALRYVQELMTAETAEDAELAEGNGDNNHKEHSPLRTSAPFAVLRDTRHHERKRRCLGPCHELFISSHCAHRFCPGCVDLVDRSPDSEEHWGEGNSNGNGGEENGNGE